MARLISIYQFSIMDPLRNYEVAVVVVVVWRRVVSPFNPR